MTIGKMIIENNGTKNKFMIIPLILISLNCIRMTSRVETSEINVICNSCINAFCPCMKGLARSMKYVVIYDN